MSWNISVIGKPKAVIAHLDTFGDGLSGQTKIEFDAAKPHLAGLVGQNFSEKDEAALPLIHLTAAGHGSGRHEEDGSVTQVHRSFSASISHMYTKLV